MITLITGPVLRRRLERTLGCNVTYRYTDPDGRVVPEYAATHIQVRCFYFTMSPNLIPALAAAAADEPGFVSATEITEHKTLRPQVVALYNRSAA